MAKLLAQSVYLCERSSRYYTDAALRDIIKCGIVRTAHLTYITSPAKVGLAVTRVTVELRGQFILRLGRQRVVAVSAREK